MSSLIHKPADLKSLHVRASPRSSRCPTVVSDEIQDQNQNLAIEEVIGIKEGANSGWIGGAVEEPGIKRSVQDGRSDDGVSDGLCVGWLGGIDSEEEEGEGDEIIFESDGWSGEGDVESKEEDRVTMRSSTQFSVAAKRKGQDLRSELEVGRGRLQHTRGQSSWTGPGTASGSREVKDDYVTSASGVDCESCLPQLTVIHQWSSLPEEWVMDSTFQEGPCANNWSSCSKNSAEGNFNSLSDGLSLNPIEYRGLGGRGRDNRDIVRIIDTDDESITDRDSKAREMGDIADTEDRKGQDTEAGTEGGTEGEAHVGGSVTAPEIETRGRASTVFLSLWDIAAYGTGALGARLEDIERYGLRSRGYLDDESDTEEEGSDIEGQSWADTDESGAGIDMFKSNLFSGGYTAIVSAAELLKTTAQIALSLPRRFSLPSTFYRPAAPKASPYSLPSSETSTPYLSRGEGVDGSDTSADQLRGSEQKAHHGSTLSTPNDNLDGTLDRRNQTKIIGKTVTDINANANTNADAGSCTFLTRLMVIKKEFFKKKSRTPGLFPKLGVDRAADYATTEGGSVRSSVLIERSVLDGVLTPPHLPSAPLSTLDLNSTGTNGNPPVNTPPNGMTQLYPSLSQTMRYSSSTLDLDHSRSRSTTLYAQSEAENQSIFSSDSYLAPASLPYGLLSLGTLQVLVIVCKLSARYPIHSSAQYSDT